MEMPTENTPQWVEPTHLNTLITRVSAVEPTHLDTLITRVSTATPTTTHPNTLVTRISARGPLPPYLLTHHKYHTSSPTPTSLCTSIKWAATPTSPPQSSPATFPATNNILLNGYIIVLVIAGILLLTSGIAVFCFICARSRRHRSKTVTVSSNSIPMTPRPTPSELEDQQSPAAPKKLDKYSYNPDFSTRDLCWRCMKEQCGGEACPRHSKNDVLARTDVRSAERAEMMRGRVYKNLGRVGSGNLGRSVGGNSSGSGDWTSANASTNSGSSGFSGLWPSFDGHGGGSGSTVSAPPPAYEGGLDEGVLSQHMVL